METQSEDMKFKITFIHSPNLLYDQNFGTYFIPLWAYTLASHVPSSWQIHIYDSKLDSLDSIPSSDIYAFSGINQDLVSMKETFTFLKIKYPNSTFIIGGPITWSLQQEKKLDELDCFDYIFILDGEESLPHFLQRYEQKIIQSLPKVISFPRFPISKAKKISFDIFKPRAKNYFGTILEVSRGCPFLCEFCDIRVLPDNNKAHNKNINLIIEELEEYHKLGITQFQFACDNFIGDIAWAHECLDAIISWKEESGAKPGIYVWLTLNLYKMPSLMIKMRKAGFSVLFIGVESVNSNSLLETAKVQNRVALDHAIREIQSYGFIVAPGFIFGFDSDTNTVFDETLNFIKNTGLLGGDPSFLIALPGTPLYKRMQMSKRLVESDENITVRTKISTNIRYLQDKEFLAEGFIKFIQVFTSPKFQYERFKNHIELMAHSKNFIRFDGPGYGSISNYLYLQLKISQNRKMLFLRVFYLLKRPTAIIAVIRAVTLTKMNTHKLGGAWNHFKFWLFMWTNIGLKYRGLKREHFNLHSVSKDFNLAATIYDGNKQMGYDSIKKITSGSEKRLQQKRFTDAALRKLIRTQV